MTTAIQHFNVARRPGNARVQCAAISVLVVALLSPVPNTQAACQSAPPAQLLERTREYSQEVPGGYGTLLRLTAGPLGNVQVSAWRKQTIRVQAHIVMYAPTEHDLDILSSIVGIVVDPTMTSVDVLTSGPHDSRWLKGVKNFPKALKTMPWRVDYDVTVPEFTALDIAVYSGETHVDGVSGIASLISASGGIYITNSSGSFVANAVTGFVDVATREKSWRGGSLNVTAGHDVMLTLPHNFAAYLEASAPGGIHVVGEDHHELGSVYKGDVGNGGGGVSITAGGKVIIAIGTEPPPEVTAEPATPPDTP